MCTSKKARNKSFIPLSKAGIQIGNSAQVSKGKAGGRAGGRGGQAGRAGGRGGQAGGKSAQVSRGKASLKHKEPVRTDVSVQLY